MADYPPLPKEEHSQQDAAGNAVASMDEALPPLLKLISSRYSFFSRPSPNRQSPPALLEGDVEMGNNNNNNNSNSSSSSVTDPMPRSSQSAQTGSTAHTAKAATVTSSSNLKSRITLPNEAAVAAASAEFVKKVSFEKNKAGLVYAKSGQIEGASPINCPKKTQKKYYSQPNPCADSNYGSTEKGKNFGIFKTRSGHFERPISRLHSRLSGTQQQQEWQNQGGNQDPCSTPLQNNISAKRYFDALTGPELDIPRDSEELLLPDNKQWPFLLRIPIGCFGVSLGLGSQTILWKALAINPAMRFLHIPLHINLVLWCLAMATLFLTFTVYGLKCVLYMEAVKREYYHPVRVNFFFAPWIVCMFLALGLPPCIQRSVHPIAWCVFMTPVFLLELKIYGQWLSGGQRRLSKVANPSTHLSVVGNFVGALLAGLVGWKEPAIFFWAVGLAHYLVLFVTLYQRLPTAEVLPKDLHPVFFLFVAAPSTASVAWKSIVGQFDLVSRLTYFVALFLYSSLVVRINFFRGFTFSFSWWAYTFPMTAAGIATIHYAQEVRNPITQSAAILLSSISAIVVSALFVLTILHGLVWGTLFPNDRAIAIMSYRERQPLPSFSKEDHHHNRHRDEADSHNTSNNEDHGRLNSHFERQGVTTVLPTMVSESAEVILNAMPNSN